MKFLSTIKRYLASHATAFAAFAAIGVGAIAFGTLSYGVSSNTTGCLDGSRYQSFRVSYANRTTGTLSTVDGKPLCKNQPMIFQSFDFASTWNGSDFLTSLPQTMHGYKQFTFPGGKTDHKVTVTVDAPEACEPTQIDFYVGSDILHEIPESNPHAGEDREVRTGKIFNATEECEQPAYTCSSLSRIQKDRDTYTFRGKAKVENGAALAGFTYEYGDGTTKYVAHTKHASDTSEYKYVDSTYSYAKAGTYNVKITGHFTVNGKTVKATSPDCQKPVTIKEKPAEKVAKCVQLEASRIGAKSFELTATAEVSGGATISSYYFVIRNVPTENPSVDPIYFQERVNSTATTASTETGELTALKDGGTYLATVAVTTSEGVVTSQNCKVTIKTKEAEKPEMVKACNTETGVIEEVEKGKENTPPYTTDLSKCDDVKVCNPETGEIIKVPKKDEDKYLPVDDEACKEAPVPEEKDVVVCNPETGEIITVKESEADKYLDKDSEECKDEPVVKGVVKELPKTGLAEQLSGILGLGALTTATYYYVTSRRNG